MLLTALAKKFFVYVCCLAVSILLLPGCDVAPDQKPRVTKEQVPVIAKIVYSVEVFRPDETAFSPLEWRQLNAGNPFVRTVYFDGRRSCTQEERSDYGFRALISYLCDTAAQVRTVAVCFPGACYAYYDEAGPAAVDEPGGMMAFPPGERTIAGFQCRKAVIREGETVQTIWYAPDVSVSDPTGAVVQDIRIPGLILEADKQHGARMGSYHVRHTVTAFEADSKIAAAVFRVPAKAWHVSEGSEAVARYRAFFDSLVDVRPQIPAEEKDRFIGRWVLRYKSDRIELLIERFGADTYTLQETQVFGGRRKKIKRGIVRFAGQKLLVPDGDGYVAYVLNAAGRLEREGDAFFVFRRQ